MVMGCGDNRRDLAYVLRKSKQVRGNDVRYIPIPGKRFVGTGLDTISYGECHHRSDKRVYEYRAHSVKH